MSAAHTPGPWLVEVDGVGIYVMTDQMMVASPSPMDKHPTESDEYIDGPETQANARLIAAAPDLLAALQKCAAQLEIINGMVHDERAALIDAHKAIAKAAGGNA